MVLASVGCDRDGSSDAPRAEARGADATAESQTSLREQADRVASATVDGSDDLVEDDATGEFVQHYDPEKAESLRPFLEREELGTVEGVYRLNQLDGWAIFKIRPPTTDSHPEYVTVREDGRVFVDGRIAFGRLVARAGFLDGAEGNGQLHDEVVGWLAGILVAGGNVVFPSSPPAGLGGVADPAFDVEQGNDRLELTVETASPILPPSGPDDWVKSRDEIRVGIEKGVRVDTEQIGRGDPGPHRLRRHIPEGSMTWERVSPSHDEPVDVSQMW